MLKTYSHNYLKKGRCVEATKRPFFSLPGSWGQALSVSDPSWAWTDADHHELNGYVAQDKHNDQDDGDQDHCDRVLQTKSVAATAATHPKTNDGNWIVASVAHFLLGTKLLGAACRCKNGMAYPTAIQALCGET